MILALDTDVLVHWQMTGADHHRAVTWFIERQVRELGASLGLSPQVVHEFLHVVTDPRRFERPMTMPAALRRAQDLWDAPEAIRLQPAPQVVHRTLALLQVLGLGRKRILDTALAATLEAAGVTRLATLNGRDYQVFSFLEVVDPVASDAS